MASRETVRLPRTRGPGGSSRWRVSFFLPAHGVHGRNDFKVIVGREFRFRRPSSVHMSRDFFRVHGLFWESSSNLLKILVPLHGQFLHLTTFISRTNWEIAPIDRRTNLLFEIDSEITPHHRHGQTFLVVNFIYFSVGARRGGKHALQHGLRTAISRHLTSFPRETQCTDVDVKISCCCRFAVWN